MTIITKPLSEKKQDKLVLPLVENEQPTAPCDDVEAQSPMGPKILILRAKAHRVSTATTLCILLISLIMVGIGIIGGSYIYRQYFRTSIFKGYCNVPYDSLGQSSALVEGNPINIDYRNEKIIGELVDYFQEKFELDIDNEEYEKIDVPDFRNGRQGRFIHDFNTNRTGIIDSTAKRCFVMPMNRDTVLPPKSLYDLLQKLWDGYYNIDTKVIRENMVVLLPAVEDMDEVGSYIAKECADMPIYRLIKSPNKVFKRSVDNEEGKFAAFSGKGILEIDIMNLDALEAAEKR